MAIEAKEISEQEYLKFFVGFLAKDIAEFKKLSKKIPSRLKQKHLENLPENVDALSKLAFNLAIKLKSLKAFKAHKEGEVKIMLVEKNGVKAFITSPKAIWDKLSDKDKETLLLKHDPDDTKDYSYI